MSSIFQQTSKKLLKKIQVLQDGLKRKASFEKFSIPDTEPEKKREEKVQVVEISSKSVAKATLTILGLIAFAYFIYSIKGLLVMFFIALFFAAALDPAVDWMESKHIPRWLGVIIIYIIVLAIIIAVIGSFIPVIVDQVGSLVEKILHNIISFFDKIQSGEALHYVPERYREWLINTLESLDIKTVIEQVFGNLTGFADKVQNLATGSLKTIGSTVGAGVSVAGSIASGVFSFIFVLFLTFFMVVDKDNLSYFFHSLFPKKHGTYISTKLAAIQKQIGAWVRGQLLVSLIMFVFAFVGLIIIGMKEYAITLALIVAIGEFIPYIGPLIFLIFALPIAFGMGLFVVVKLAIFYAIMQFFDGNIVVPAVMRKVVGLSPIVVLMVLIIGFQFLGVIGAVIAVPVTTAVAIFINDYTKSVADK